MGSIVTISVGEHRVALAPDGVTTVDGVSISPTDWKRLTEVVTGHHVRLGLAPDRSHRQPSSLIRVAPWWVRFVTFGKVSYLPGMLPPRGLRTQDSGR